MSTQQTILKMTRRSIRSFFGRYLALLLIVLLSVGFFSGLKISKKAMQDTADAYLEEQKMYDFRILSRSFFLQSDVSALQKIDGIEYAEAASGTDAMVTAETASETDAIDAAEAASGTDAMVTAENSSPSHGLALRVQSLQSSVNLPHLTAGRMPEYTSECLADRRLFSESDIGKKLTIDTDASDQAAGFLVRTKFTIVGLADSPLYISTDRGTTTIGSGRLDGFLLVPDDAFNGAVSTEIDLILGRKEYIYSDEYDRLVKDTKKQISKTLDDRAISAYILTRNENPGYLSFKNDTAIVSGIADIFPLFFVLIGMLVCITTMTRMAGEERTQIGTLKALGLSGVKISAKYLLYSGSAALLGWLFGFFPGTFGIPQVFWFAYGTVYGFAPLHYVFSPDLAALTLVFTMAAILLSTWYAIRRELSEQPAQLIRPKAARKGKRILLEKITPLWRSLSFLRKITLRNMFRYRQRLIMMLTGIGCCCALVVCGFGVRDSLLDITSLQFDHIQKYQMEVSVEKRKISEVGEALAQLKSQESASGSSEVSAPESPDNSSIDMIDGCLPVGLFRATLEENGNAMTMVKVYSSDRPEDFAGYWTLENYETPGSVTFPRQGQAVVCKKIAETLHLSEGNSLTIQDTDQNKIKVKVSGIFDNYIENALVVNAATLKEQNGQWKPDTLLVRTTGTQSQVQNADRISGEEAEGAWTAGKKTAESLAEQIQAIDGVTTVLQLSDTRKTADRALACVHYIVLLLVLFSGALQFLVIYNLTSINLEERSREIATIEVLGFYPKETDRYVLSENLVLSVIAGFIGLPLGALFHHAVMDRIVVANMVFDIHIRPVSYLFSLIVTVSFAAVVNLFMRRQIRKIPMAESLKAVE